MVAPIGSIPSWITQAVAPAGAGTGAAASGAAGAAGATAADATSSSNAFGNALADSLQKVGDLQANADNLANQVATGSLQDIHDYTIAATEAATATELTVAVRNKAVEAFTEIMRMQI